jgi:hypothetical protein
LRATLPFGSAVMPKSRLARYVFRSDFSARRMINVAKNFALSCWFQ